MLPSIWNDNTTFLLDFEGSRFLETSKINQKMHRQIAVFFYREKNFPGPVFLRAGVHFGISFGARSCTSGSLFLSTCVKSQLGRLTPLGSGVPDKLGPPIWDLLSKFVRVCVSGHRFHALEINSLFSHNRDNSPQEGEVSQRTWRHRFQLCHRIQDRNRIGGTAVRPQNKTLCTSWCKLIQFNLI